MIVVEIVCYCYRYIIFSLKQLQILKPIQYSHLHTAPVTWQAADLQGWTDPGDRGTPRISTWLWHTAKWGSVTCS
jgi:hypothetical protein